MDNLAKVNLWGRTIGVVRWNDTQRIGEFQYMPEFARSGIQLSPLRMPLTEFPYTFPALPYETFRGLPGMLADSLPDKFGNAVINAWLSRSKRDISSVNPVERLCYVGQRGIGALEYEPALLDPLAEGEIIEVASLVELSNRILNERGQLGGVLTGQDDLDAMTDILRVGTSAGGARAKAILAWNPVTNEFRSGQLPARSGFEQWILKFDGISNNKDKELADPKGYGKIEYAYSLMAKEAGIVMTECRLHHEGGRSHFMTKRFDRTDTGNKIHMQSLCAMAHVDFNQAGVYSYEQTLMDMKHMQLPRVDLEQQVLRAMFNVVGRNHDDHVKNIAFLMTPDGAWRLSPAYDISYAYDPQGKWTSTHQMVINGKRDDFTADDLIALAEVAAIKPKKAKEMLQAVVDVIKRWGEFAIKAGVDKDNTEKIRKTQRVNLSE
jgi:serine/threonine-protein kinase HipA